MAKPELLQSAASLYRRIDVLIDRQKKLLEEVERLQNENKILKEKSLRDAVRQENLEKEIEFLKLSHRLAASPEALVEARKKISSLIRTIDSCIRMIKED